jgi:hypothetical protein
LNNTNILNKGDFEFFPLKKITRNCVNNKGVIFEGDLENTRVTELTGMGYKKATP